MPIDNVHRILEIYAYFKSKTGDTLISNHFLAIGERMRWSPADLQEGIEEAHRRGWVEKEGGWKLTSAGFDQVAKLQHV